MVKRYGARITITTIVPGQRLMGVMPRSWLLKPLYNFLLSLSRSMHATTNQTGTPNELENLSKRLRLSCRYLSPQTVLGPF